MLTLEHGFWIPFCTFLLFCLLVLRNISFSNSDLWLSCSVCLQSVWILILVSQFCPGLRAVFWNADLWRCHHSSMSWVSALPPSLALLFTQPWWRALFLSDSSGQPQSCPACATFSAEKVKIWDTFCWHLQVTNSQRLHFFPPLFSRFSLISVHLVRHVMVMQLTPPVRFIFILWHCVSQYSTFHRSVFTAAPHWGFSL